MNVLRVGFLLLLIGLLCVESRAAFAADRNTWVGYLVDKQCADSIKGSSTTESFVEAHTKDCALMCKAKGYRLYSLGRWLDFDDKGNNLALKLVQESKRIRGFYVQVTGKVTNNILLVEKLQEIPALKSSKHNGVNNNGSR